jgi:hypothetical protein
VQALDGGYYELNFAPSTQWAAYRFDGYRSGMAAAELLAAPRIAGAATAGGYELEVEATSARCPTSRPTSPGGSASRPCWRTPAAAYPIGRSGMPGVSPISITPIRSLSRFH